MRIIILSVDIATLLLLICTMKNKKEVTNLLILTAMRRNAVRAQYCRGLLLQTPAMSSTLILQSPKNEFGPKPLHPHPLAEQG